MPHRQIQVIGWLVEQQQVGPAGDENGERQACPFAAGEIRGRLEHPLAAEAEAAEMVAALLLRPRQYLAAAAPGEFGERRAAGIELLELQLRQEAGGQLRRGLAPARERDKLAGQHAHQRGFAGAIPAEDPEAVARADA